MEFGLVLGYMAMLYLGASITPEVGILGKAITLVPWSLLEWAHAPGYGALAWMTARGLQFRGWPRFYALLIASAAAFVFGMWMEVYQGNVPGRSTSSEDLIVNGIGIGIAAMIMWKWDTRSYAKVRRPNVTRPNPQITYSQR